MDLGSDLGVESLELAEGSTCTSCATERNCGAFYWKLENWVQWAWRWSRGVFLVCKGAVLDAFRFWYLRPSVIYKNLELRGQAWTEYSELGIMSNTGISSPGWDRLESVKIGRWEQRWKQDSTFWMSILGRLFGKYLIRLKWTFFLRCITDSCF